VVLAAWIQFLIFSRLLLHEEKNTASDSHLWNGHGHLSVFHFVF